MSKKNKKSNKSEDSLDEYLKAFILNLETNKKPTSIKRNKARRFGQHPRGFSSRKCRHNNCLNKGKQVKIKGKPNGTKGEVHARPLENTDDE